MFLAEIPVLDTLQHSAGWLNTAPWKTAKSASEVTDSASGSQNPGFSTIGRAFNSTVFNAPCGATLTTNNSGPVTERYAEIWACYNDTEVNGYRAKFVYKTETKIEVILYKVEKGVEKELGKAEVGTWEANMKLAIWVTRFGNIEAWIQNGGGLKLWERLTVFADTGTKYTSGNVAIGGSGSNPTYTNVTAGEELLLVGSEGLYTEEENEGEKEAVALQFTAAHSGVVSSIAFHTGKVESTCTSVLVGIYADNAGAPGTLLGEYTVAGKPATNTWIEAHNLSGITITKGQVYWIAAMPLGGTLKVFTHITAGGTTNLRLKSGSGSTLPAGSAYGANLVRGPAPFLAGGALEPAPEPAPELTNPGTQRSGLNMFDELQLFSSHATSASATGVPPGMAMVFSNNTITFTGQPTVPGTYTTKVEVTGEGGKTSQTFTWIVEQLAIARGRVASIRDRYPLRLTIGKQDYTQLLTETFTFSNVDPGGYEMASFSLPGDLPLILRGMNVRLDCALGVVWEGRVKEVDRTLGTKTLIQCEGYGTLLKDTSIREIYVDRDFTKWVAPSAERQIVFLKKEQSPTGPTLGPSQGGVGSIATIINGNWEATSKPICIATYIAGIPIGSLYYAWEKSPQISAADANWDWHVAFGYLSEGGTEGFLELEPMPNLRAEGPGEGTAFPGADFVFIPATNITLSLRYAVGPAGGPNQRYAVYWTKIAVYGQHGLTKRGPSPGGFYTYDIVKHALSKVAGIQPGIIVPEGVSVSHGGWRSLFIVPHALYSTPTPVEQIVSDMAKYQGGHWGVWESLTPLTGDPRPRLDFRPYPENPTAWCLRAECENVDVREDLENLYDIALVSYTEAAGQEHTVEIKRPNALLEQAGIKGRMIPLSLGVGTEGSAKAYGEIVLALLEDQARCTGTATIAGEIHTMRGEQMPAFALKAGLDRLRISDLPSLDAFGENSDLPISRVECTGTPEGITTNISFGRGPNLVEELTARLERATEVAVNDGG